MQCVLRARTPLGPPFAFRFRSANSSHRTASFSICAPMQAQQHRRHRLHIRCARHDACSISPREKEGSQCTLQLLAMFPRPCCMLRLGRFAFAQERHFVVYSRLHIGSTYVYTYGRAKQNGMASPPYHTRSQSRGHCSVRSLPCFVSISGSICALVVLCVIALAVFRDLQASHSALLSDIEQQQSIKAAKVPLMVRTLLSVEPARLVFCLANISNGSGLQKSYERTPGNPTIEAQATTPISPFWRSSLSDAFDLQFRCINDKINRCTKGQARMTASSQL